MLHRYVCAITLGLTGAASATSVPAMHPEIYAIECPNFVVPAADSLDMPRKSKLVEYVRQRWLHAAGQAAEPPAWTLDDAPGYALHVAFRVGGTALGQGIAAGDHLQANADAAVGRALELARAMRKSNTEIFAAEDAAVLSVEVTLFYDYEPIVDRLLLDLREEIDHGRHGVALRHANKLSILPASAWLGRDYTHRSFLQQVAKSAGAESEAFRDRNTPLWRLECVHLAQSGPGVDVLELTRGDRVIPIAEVTLPRVETWLAAMGRWLIGNVRDNGRMEYMYIPETGRYERSNNMIRQWMATQALAALYEYTMDEAYDTAWRKNSDYNLKTFYREEGELGYIIYDNKAKLGAAACAIMALLNAPDHAAYAKYVHKLKNLIVHLHREDGSFQTHYMPADRDSGHAFYPGESLLALAFYQEHFPESDFRELVASSRDYYLKKYRADGRTAAYVPWHTMAYWHWYKRTKDTAFRDAAFEMNDWLICIQDLDSTAKPEILGRFYQSEFGEHGPPHASATAVYVEGLAYAYDMARTAGDTDRQQAYLNAIRWGLRSLMQLQYRPENAAYTRVPERALGGLRTTVQDSRMRCDNTQHAIMAGIAVLRFVEAEALVAPKPKARIFRAERLKHFMGEKPGGAGSQSMRLLLGGDMQLARRTQATARQRGMHYGLAGLRDVLQDVDAMVTNLECVVATGGAPARKTGGRVWHFRASPEMLRIFSEDVINVVSIANNHSMDYGAEALTEMIEVHLPAHNILFAGAGPDEARAAEPRYFRMGNLEVAFFSTTTIEPHLRATATTPGYNWVPEDDLDGFTQRLRAAWSSSSAPSDVQILAIHWGRNYDDRASDMHRDMARAAVDLGFDMVIGHHAHVFQGIEVYNGAPIFYDLGNCLVDFKPRHTNLESIMPVVVIDRDGVRQVDVLPVLLHNEAVRLAGDDAAERILQRLASLSQRHGTRLDIRAGRAALALAI